MKVRFRIVLLVFLSALCVLPVHGTEASQKMVDTLVNAIPREMIPANYQNQQRARASSSSEEVEIRFNGPNGAWIMFSLNRFSDFPKPITELIKMEWKGRTAEEVLSRSLGIGEASAHVQEITDIGRRRVFWQRVAVGWKKYRLRVRIHNYSRVDGTHDFSDEDAGKLIQQLAKATYDRIKGEPDLARISVEQRHITYNTAKITVKAKAAYPMIGNYKLHDITFKVHISGPDSHTKTFDAYATQVRRKGQDLYLEWSFETKKTGKYGVEVVLKDIRYKSAASNSRMTFALERKLGIDFEVVRPVAEIMTVTRQASVMRNNHSTVLGGLIATSEKKYHEPKDINMLVELAEMLGEDTSMPGEFEATRIWEPIENETSHFLYEGDRVGLWGFPDPAFQMPRDIYDEEGFRLWLESGCSSVVLEWENGVQGQAIWNPNKRNLNSANGAHFVVGATRKASEKWKLSWLQWFGEKARSLTEQYVGKKVDEEKSSMIDWFLERQGISPDAMPSFSVTDQFERTSPDTPSFLSRPNPVALFFQIYNLSAGDTVYDDLIYLNLNSRVYVSAAGLGVKVFTFEGSPEILDPKRDTKVTVKPGRMVTVKPGSVSEPRSFSTADLVATQKPSAGTAIQKDLPDQGQQKWDIPQLNANVTKFTFFESADPPLSYSQRTFVDTFDAKTSRLIFWHFGITYPKRDSNLLFNLETICYGPDGNVYARWIKNFRIEKEWSRSYYSSGWGSNKGGTWKPGVYQVDLLLEGQVIAQGSFTVKGAGDTVYQSKPIQGIRVPPMVDPMAGWKRFTDANGISLLAPPGFKTLKTKGFSLAIQALDTQNRVDRVMMLRKKEKPVGTSMRAFQQDLIDNRRKKFKDFHDLHSWWQFYGLPGYWFTFRYTWDGRSIQALYYQDPSAVVPLEIRYASPQESFKMQEVEAIIRSVYAGK